MKKTILIIVIKMATVLVLGKMAMVAIPLIYMGMEAMK